MADYLHRKSHTHQRAREALRKAGHKGSLQKIDALVCAIEVETGRVCVGDQTEYIRAWLDSLPVAARRTPTPFKALEISPGLRANFERAARDQPKLWTPAGRVGNGNENSPVWRR